MQGFQAQNVPSILVQANRTATVNAELKVGNVNQSITVEETPMLNAVDMTNGYVLDKLQIDSVPLPTGSFTGLALLSPGVNAGTVIRYGSQRGAGKRSGVGQWPARYQQLLLAERRGLPGTCSMARAPAWWLRREL